MERDLGLDEPGPRARKADEAIQVGDLAVKRRSATLELLSPGSPLSDLPVEERPDARGVIGQLVELADHRPLQPAVGDIGLAAGAALRPPAVLPLPPMDMI